MILRSLFLLAIVALDPIQLGGSSAEAQPGGAASCSRVAPLVAEVVEIRGLPVKARPACEDVDETTFRRIAHDLVRRDATRMPLSEQARLLQFLGFIPSEYPYERCVIDEYARRAMAFYSPRLGKLMLPSWYQVPDGILVHEIVHALQDQHFETDDHGTFPYMFDDRNLAAAMVLEGDAMRVEEVWRQRHKQPEEKDGVVVQLQPTSPECEIPVELGDLASSIYEYGQHAARVRHERGGCFDKELHTPPVSTAQLLHTTLEPECGQACRSRQTLIVGELAIRMLLKKHISPREAVLGAHGWASDQVTLAANSIQWETRWRSEMHAQEFFQAYVSWWSKELGVPLSRAPSALQIQHGERTVRIERKGESVRTRMIITPAR